MCVLSVPTCSNRSKARAVFSGVECVRSVIRAVLQYLVAIYCSCMRCIFGIPAELNTCIYIGYMPARTHWDRWNSCCTVQSTLYVRACVHLR